MWIAFIFISLTYQKQFTIMVRYNYLVVNCFHFYIFDISETVEKQSLPTTFSCELLSFLYLWHIRNSLILFFFVFFIVVNCFHFYIFDISETVKLAVKRGLDMLWIAFIFISLTYQKQCTQPKKERHFCCELLSFLYLWHIRNSILLLCPLLLGLWIAFIFISLTYQKQ